MKVLLFSVAYLAATAPETNSKLLDNDDNQAIDQISQDLQDESDISDLKADELQNDHDEHL